jgi:hypothetical protein
METRSPIDIPALNKFLESVGSYTVDLIFSPGGLQALYHYTDLKGMQGIVDNHDLWLTNSRYSNDDEESTHGYEIVREIIKEELAKPNNPERTDYLNELSRIFTTPPAEGVYICCFCEKDNLLSQWRSYGANGTGVSISFNPTGFSYITGADSPPSGLVRLWKVFYDRNIQQSIVRSAIEFAFFDDSTKTIAERATRSADAIQFFIPTFKNQYFEEVKEVRLIFTPFPNSPAKPQFRIARSMLVPYYSLRELTGGTTPHPLPIASVRVGPSINKGLNLESAKMLLTKAGYTAVNVESSDTPYRG